jgi:hypothetical protein
MFRLPLLVVLVVAVQSHADGVALIELENASTVPVEAKIGEKTYTVKAKSSHKVFLAPGKYVCTWGDDKKLVCSLSHGDITVIPITAPPEKKEKEKEVPKIPSVVIPADIIKPPPNKEKEPPPTPKKIEEQPRPPPPRDEEKPPKKEEPPQQPNSATVKVIVPLGATSLMLDGMKMKKLDPKKTEYSYWTPSLQCGRQYYYDITVEINGFLHRRRVYVYANRTTTVDFR